MAAMSSKRTAKKQPARVNVPLTMNPDLAAKVDEAAAKTRLSKQDVMRLSIERGIEVLVSQLTSSPAA